MMTRVNVFLAGFLALGLASGCESEESDPATEQEQEGGKTENPNEEGPQFCTQALTCWEDGNVYPTGCGPENGDQPIEDSGIDCQPEGGDDSSESDDEPKAGTPCTAGGFDAAEDTSCGESMFCQTEEEGCSGEGTCQPINLGGSCFAVEAPVCGCNGITYGNSCKAGNAGQNVASQGACEGSDEPPELPEVGSACTAGGFGAADNPCGQGQFCQVEDGCEGEGTCQELNIGGICQTVFAPVCGCNGETYSNDCRAGNAGQNIRNTGACE